MTTPKLTDSGRIIADAQDRVAAAARALEDSKNKVNRALSIRNSDRAELDAAKRLLDDIMHTFPAVAPTPPAPAPTSPANDYVVYLRDHRDIEVTADSATHKVINFRAMLVFTVAGETAHVAEFDLASVVGVHRTPIKDK